VAFLPAGSQIALRIDLERVRRSPLAPAVRNALAAIPDWQTVLEGSGIDPVDDLDRLLVASPNLDPARMIAAGRSSGDEASIRAAAERMAAASGTGTPLAWRTEEGVPVADWHDRSGVERIIALIGPRHFVIARPVDLPRVMAVARVRASADGEPPHEIPADALLSMQEGEGLSLEVEGFRHFASARQGGASAELLPTRLRLGIAERGARIAADVTGRFDNEEQASAAAPHWEGILREQVVPNPALSFAMSAVGAGGVLPRIQMNNRGETVHAGVEMSMSEMRGVLGLVPMVLSMRRRPQAIAPPRPPTAPPTPSEAAPPAPPEPAPSEPPPEQPPTE
jgi:hypothetical protein